MSKMKKVPYTSMGEGREKTNPLPYIVSSRGRRPYYTMSMTSKIKGIVDFQL